MRERAGLPPLERKCRGENPRTKYKDRERALEELRDKKQFKLRGLKNKPKEKERRRVLAGAPADWREEREFRTRGGNVKHAPERDEYQLAHRVRAKKQWNNQYNSKYERAFNRDEKVAVKAEKQKEKEEPAPKAVKRDCAEEFQGKKLLQSGKGKMLNYREFRFLIKDFEDTLEVPRVRHRVKISMVERFKKEAPQFREIIEKLLEIGGVELNPGPWNRKEKYRNPHNVQDREQFRKPLKITVVHKIAEKKRAQQNKAITEEEVQMAQAIANSIRIQNNTDDMMDAFKMDSPLDPSGPLLARKLSEKEAAVQEERVRDRQGREEYDCAEDYDDYYNRIETESPENCTHSTSQEKDFTSDESVGSAESDGEVDWECGGELDKGTESEPDFRRYDPTIIGRRFAMVERMSGRAILACEVPKKPEVPEAPRRPIQDWVGGVHVTDERLPRENTNVTLKEGLREQVGLKHVPLADVPIFNTIGEVVLKEEDESAYRPECFAPVKGKETGVHLFDGARPLPQVIDAALHKYAPEFVLKEINYATIGGNDQRLQSLKRAVDMAQGDVMIGFIEVQRVRPRRPFRSIFMPDTVEDSIEWGTRVRDWLLGPEVRAEDVYTWVFCPHAVSEALHTVPMDVNEISLKRNIRTKISNVIQLNVPDTIALHVAAASEFVAMAIGPQQLNSTACSTSVGLCTVRKPPEWPNLASIQRYSHAGMNRPLQGCHTQVPTEIFERNVRAIDRLRSPVLHAILDGYNGAMYMVTHHPAQTVTVGLLLIAVLTKDWTLSCRLCLRLLKWSSRSLFNILFGPGSRLAFLISWEFLIPFIMGFWITTLGYVLNAVQNLRGAPVGLAVC